MIVTLEEMKQYLRVDYEDDDQLITGFITTAEQLCRDVLRIDGEADLSADGKVKTAVMYVLNNLVDFFTGLIRWRHVKMFCVVGDSLILRIPFLAL